MKHLNTLLTLIFVVIISSRCHSQDNDFTGYATASVNQDSIIDIDYFGFSDKEKLIKYNKSTIQPIGSVSKTFIGISLMIAKEHGLLDLDEDINKYLDFELINPHSRKVHKTTLRHLATHTSGIIDYQKAYESSYSKGLEPNMALGIFLKEYLSKGGSKYSKKNFNKSIPGTKYEYSNIGSAIAAYIIEKVSGISFDLFTEKYIFEPLGMKNTGWFYRDIVQSNHAILYDEKDKALLPYSCSIYPDGSLKTTINDLSIYLIELIKGFDRNSKLLSKKSWSELFKQNFGDYVPVKNIDEKEPNAGIFIAYFKSGAIGHTGSDLGVSTVMLFNPKTKIGKIFMGNEDITKQNLGKFKLIWKNIEW